MVKGVCAPSMNGVAVTIILPARDRLKRSSEGKTKASSRHAIKMLLTSAMLLGMLRDGELGHKAPPRARLAVRLQARDTKIFPKETSACPISSILDPGMRIAPTITMAV